MLLEEKRKKDQGVFLADSLSHIHVSARKELIVLQKLLGQLKTEHVKSTMVVNQSDLNPHDKIGLMDILKKLMNAQHNHQCTASQLNSRFSDAGYCVNYHTGEKNREAGFHPTVDRLPAKELPIIKWFFSKDRTSPDNHHATRSKAKRETHIETIKSTIHKKINSTKGYYGQYGNPKTKDYKGLYDNMLANQITLWV